MAITITKLKMWKNPGYTKGCVEAPPAGSWKLPTPDYASTVNLRPRKGSTISAVELPLSFCEVFDMSYLYMEATDSANHTIKVFGWIDSVEQTASSDEAVLIRWSVDYWRTYSGSVTFGAGQITKCSNSSYKRPYRTQPRYWKSSVADLISLADERNICMVYLIVVMTHAGASWIQRFEFPVNTILADNNVAFKKDGDATTYYGLSLRDCYNGYIDELLTSYCAGQNDLTFEIIGCYVSAIIDEQWRRTTTPWSTSISTFITGTVRGNSRSMAVVFDIVAQFNDTYNPTLITDDTTMYSVLDYMGNNIGNLPYGVEITGVEVRLDIGVNGAYERVVFSSPIFTSQGSYAQIRTGKNLGIEFSVPCPTIPITDNQWSAYLTGGQRDYDITSARIANDQKAVAGLEATFSAGIGGGVTGASAGPLGAIGGMIGGLIGQGAMTAIQYGLGQNFNDQLQDAKDRLYANQKNGIMLSGGSMESLTAGWDADTLNKGTMLMKLTADAVSAAEYTADVTINGYDVNIPVGSAASFITAGGPIRITQLMVTGSVPPQAKTAIKSMLETGLRIVENNPSGVIP